MGYSVSGQLSITVYVEGVEIFLSPNDIISFYIVENAIHGLPSFRLDYIDRTSVFVNGFPISDGTSITIEVGDGTNSTTATFRSFGSPNTIPGTDSQRVSIAGYLDVPSYLYSVYFGGFTGTSSQALQDIATKSSMKYEGVSTNDNMTWVSGNKSFFTFASWISSHGWVDNQSCMGIGVDVTKTLHYVNLSKIAKGNPKHFIYYGLPTKTSAQNSLMCLDYKMMGVGGLLNKIGGYNTVVSQESMDGSFAENQDVSATKLSNYLGMNAQVKNTVGVVNSIYIPPNCGNGGSRFEQAKLQNTRIKSTYSSMVDVVLDRFSTVKMFDLVEFYLPNLGDRSGNQMYSGMYIVSAKLRTSVGTRYFEKLRLTSTGIMSTQGGLV